MHARLAFGIAGVALLALAIFGTATALVSIGPTHLVEWFRDGGSQAVQFSRSSSIVDVNARLLATGLCLVPLLVALLGAWLFLAALKRDDDQNR